MNDVHIHPAPLGDMKVREVTVAKIRSQIQILGTAVKM